MPAAHRSRYDAEARDFDARAGLPEAARSEIARAIVELGALGAGGLLVEIGAGTGELGCELIALGVEYVALDESAAMLEQFRARLGKERAASLVEADAGERWPVADGTAKAVFGSRSLHLLDPSHVAAEFARVASPLGAALVAGRLLRSPDDPRARLRSEMRRLLRRTGGEPRSGERELGRLLEECRAFGAEPVPPRRAARFNRPFRARDAIAHWANKERIAAVVLDEKARHALALELEGWATREFGDIDAPLESIEEYWLHGARIDRKSSV